jgi:SAM-dependent methyltransferase
LTPRPGAPTWIRSPAEENMLDVKNPEIDVDALMQRIQEKIQQRRVTVPEDDAGALSGGGAPASAAMEQLLARARQAAAIGADLPAMNRTQGAARLVARPIAKAFLRIAQLITRDQRTFNFALLEAVRSLHDRSGEVLSHLASARSQIASLREQLRVATGAPHLDAARYQGFEDAVRGPREEIKKRVAVYLPSLREGAGAERSPILDLGCGRGELLELLREEGLPASGVDSDRSAVDHCRERGLDVAEEDACDALGKIPDGSLGGVTAIQVVEHLPPVLLFKLIDEAYRVLRPGGVLILETPDPRNVFVGASDFYLHPTRRHPIHPRTLQVLLEGRDMVRVETLTLRPHPADARLPEDSPLARAFNAYFYGPREFAVIGRRR